MKETNVVQLISKLQEQINSMDKKLDMIMGRVMSTPVLMAQSTRPVEQKPPSKSLYPIVCSACGKHDSLPFKPSEGRPVFCKECFTAKRKGSNAPIRAENSKPAAAVTIAAAPAAVEAKQKKKAAAKKTVTKKKTTAKKK